MSTVLISVESVLLVLLVVLVAGLLRSHAEILRRLGPGDAGGGGPAAFDTAAAASVSAVPAPRPGDIAPRPAPAISGVTPAGDPVRVDFAGAGAGPLTLLAFLSSGCGTCQSFWRALAEPLLPPGVGVAVVTRGSDRERPAGVAALAPDGLPVVMSSQAWADYAVPGAPYFVLVSDRVLGEGAAASWSALASLVSDAVQDERYAAAGGLGQPGAGARPGTGGAARAESIDETLMAAGIGPGHPSLYPSREAQREQLESADTGAAGVEVR